MIASDGSIFFYPQFERKHLFVVQGDLSIVEGDFFLSDGQTEVYVIDGLKTLGKDLFETRQAAEREVAKRRGPKFAEGTWVYHPMKGTFQVGKTHQGFASGMWYYGAQGESDAPYGEDLTQEIPAPVFAEGDWAAWRGFDGQGEFPPGRVTSRHYLPGSMQWEYSSDKLVGTYPVSSFKVVADPAFEVGDYASCGCGSAHEIVERTFDHDTNVWRYRLADERGTPVHSLTCLHRGEKPAEKPALPVTPRFQMGQRVQWEYSWYNEEHHGVVTSIVLDEDGDLCYGVTPDGEDMTSEADRHDFYDYADGSRDEYLMAEQQPETASASF